MPNNILIIKRDIAKQKLRQQTSEHPFGTIKWYDGAGYFLCRGMDMAKAEFALSALAYNIRRAINICGGVQKLIDLYRRIAVPKMKEIMAILWPFKHNHDHRLSRWFDQGPIRACYRQRSRALKICQPQACYRAAAKAAS